MEIIDMAGNINDVFNLLQRLRTNPIEILSMKFNIPQNVDINNPNDIIQYLLNTRQVTQTQVNEVMGLRNNPMIQQLMNKH